MKYKNSQLEYKTHLKEIAPLIIDMIKNKSKESKPKNKSEIPIKNLNKKDIENMENYSVVRMGHSTLLFKIEGEYILTDPIFSKRASPFSFMGPKRFHDTPIDIEDLPFINSVIISHDHYDHLDKQSIKRLKDKVGTFYTPLKVGLHLIRFGVSREKIIELDWWQSFKKNDIKFVCTPSQHFSGRTLFDRDKTLWSSWVIQSPKGSFFFGADGGYFNGFKEIGLKYGPFDMTFLEVGAYNKRWSKIHMMPEQGIQAHEDLRGKVLFPIHNGTFDLSKHSWYEPFDRINNLTTKKDIDTKFPIMGEIISLINHSSNSKWWE